MDLVLDFGNTRIKAGLFKNGRIASVQAFITPQELLDSAITEEAGRIIICSVTSFHVPVMEHMKNQQVLLFKPDTPVPLVNKYESALTLGSDRLACAVGAGNIYPGRNVLSIDAGTCIKYNFVNKNGEYLGGAISPGIPMRLKAMNHYTQRLPLIDPEPDYNRLIGQNTAHSLLSGSITAAACEANGMIDRYREEYPDLVVLLTGGDASYLAGQLKNSFFAQPNLLLQGLHAILTYNIEK